MGDGTEFLIHVACAFFSKLGANLGQTAELTPRASGRANFDRKVRGTAPVSQWVKRRTSLPKVFRKTAVMISQVEKSTGSATEGGQYRGGIRPVARVARYSPAPQTC